MILYSSDFCPFCYSCRMVLLYKGLDYEEIVLDLSQKSKFIDRLSPFGYVPVLVHGTRKIYESVVINEYLDDMFSDAPLLPEEPVRKANARFWIKFVHDRVVSAYFALMNSEDPSAWSDLNSKLSKWFYFLEDHAFSEIWVTGGQISLADMTLYPWVERFVSVERYRGGNIPSDCKNLFKWIDAMRETSAVKGSGKTEEQYIEFFDRYWTPIHSKDTLA